MRSGEKNILILKKMFSVTGVVVLSKLLGFAKQMVTAGEFGATIETDLISLSQNVIGDIDYLLVQVFLTAFVPIYVGIKSRNKEDADRFVSNSLIIWLFISAVIVLGLELSAPIISNIIAPSYGKILQLRLTGYLRIYAPTISIMIVCAILNALLKANERFVPGEFISIIQSVVMIVLIRCFGQSIGVIILLIGYFAYTLADVLFLAVASRKEWKMLIKRPFYDSNIQQMISMSLPLLLGYSIVFVNQQVDKVIVSGLGDGIVTSVGYAAVLINLVSTLVSSVCSVVFTYVSQDVANGHEKRAAELVMRFFVFFTTILAPVSVLIIMNAADIVRIVYGRGSFSDKAVMDTAAALMGYGVSSAFYAYRDLFSRLHYSYKDSRRPMINSSIGIGFNILLSIVLSKYIGVLGVTLASSISMVICSVLNILSCRKHNRYIKFSGIVKYIPFWVSGIIVCIISSWRIRAHMPGLNACARFPVTVMISAIIYGAICLPLIIKNKSILGTIFGKR